jgi:hypothetical protein
MARFARPLQVRHGTLLARLDRLAPVREVAQVAACPGRYRRNLNTGPSASSVQAGCTGEVA